MSQCPVGQTWANTWLSTLENVRFGYPRTYIQKIISDSPLKVPIQFSMDIIIWQCADISMLYQLKSQPLKFLLIRAHISSFQNVSRVQFERKSHVYTPIFGIVHWKRESEFQWISYSDSVRIAPFCCSYKVNLSLTPDADMHKLHIFQYFKIFQENFKENRHWTWFCIATSRNRIMLAGIERSIFTVGPTFQAISVPF